MDNYFFIDPQGQKQGPVQANLLAGCGVTSDTLVWKEGMDKWVKASSVPELAQFFPPSPVQMPPVGQPYAGVNNNGGIPPKPDTYLVWTILTTILCCLPLGAYAIYCSTRVDSYYMAGNYAEAQRQSANAKKWAIVAAIVGPVLYIIFWIIYAAVIAAAISGSRYY